jgi:hypothetical protein
MLQPDAIGRPSRIEDYELGGIALNDASQGLQVQNWRLQLVGTEIRVAPEPYTSETVLITAAGITQCSLAFDQNMNPAVAYMQFNQAKLYWFDSVPGEMVTTTLASDVRSPFLSMDDKRDKSNTRNDVLLFYIRSNRLCYRQQRDRFNTERTLAWFDGNLLSIRKAGMNDGLRMQIEVVGLSNKLAQGAVLSGWRTAAYLATVTSITRAMPGDILATDLLYAVLMHRSAVTPPAGWTLVTSQACTQDAVTQTISLLKKTTPAPGDSNANATFTQASADRMGLMYFAVRATSGTPTLIASSLAVVDDTETNTVTAPSLTAAGTELFVVLATSIVATADVTQPVVSPGLGPFGGTASQCRLGAAYMRRTTGKTNPGRFTFDNGTPVNNGLAAMTLRFGTV